MDRDLAKAFADQHQAFGEWFNKMTELSLRMPDEASAKIVRRALGDLWMALDEVVVLPLRKEHPDLFPDLSEE